MTKCDVFLSCHLTTQLTTNINKKGKMVVDKLIRNNWKILLDHGDIQKIVDSTIKESDPNGISRNTISNAIRTGRCSETTFEAIQAYLRKKKEETKRFVKQNIIEID